MINLIVSGILGRMGKEIIALCEEYDDINIVGGFDKREGEITYPVSSSIDGLTNNFDAVVDFTSPQGAIEILGFCLKNKKPFVTGTTGFSQEQENLIKDAGVDIAVFKASNMSMGINTVAKLLRDLPRVFYDGNDIEIVESHHRMKADSPSGTAGMLVKIIADKKGDSEFIYGRKGTNLKRKKKEIGVHSIRGGTVVGKHTIYFWGDDESVEITHSAYSRRIFASGALNAVKWIVGKKPGLYGMDDLLRD
jgi:4-hydroxy-tetrahydrodipicolinate reductase